MPSNTSIQANGAIRTGELTKVGSLQANDTVVVTIFSANANGQVAIGTF
jgi:hypothetical protein